MSTSTDKIQELVDKEYEYGFVTDIEQDTIPKGSMRRSSASSRRKRTSPHGCSSGG